MSSAIISPCGMYRYTLHRNIPQPMRWVKPCLFCLLNPSTADATTDDPTLRRGMGFAKEWGCTSLTFVNLFAYRATDPRQLKEAVDPVGPENVNHIIEQINKHFRIGIIVVAWGSHALTGRQRRVQHLFAQHGAQCFGTNKDGSPRHPLYLRKDASLQLWDPTSIAVTLPTPGTSANG